jgi:hypothetical protein
MWGGEPGHEESNPYNTGHRCLLERLEWFFPLKKAHFYPCLLQGPSRCASRGLCQSAEGRGNSRCSCARAEEAINATGVHPDGRGDVADCCQAGVVAVEDARSIHVWELRRRWQGPRRGTQRAELLARTLLSGCGRLVHTQETTAIA